MSRLPFELLLALRYLRPKRTFVSVITLISIIGVMLGVAVLIVVISVMTGFDQELRNRLLGFNAHLRIEGIRPLENYREVMEVVRKNPHVKGVAPYVLGQVMVRTQPEFGSPKVIGPLIRGVDANTEPEVSDLFSSVVSGTNNLRGNGLLVGAEFARKMGLGPGDTLTVYSVTDFERVIDILEKHRQGNEIEEGYLPSDYEVRGVFDLGYFEFNDLFIVASLGNAQDLFSLGDRVHGVMVMLDNPDLSFLVKSQIGPELGGLHIWTWQEENAGILDALRVEKNVMFYLLFFIMIVAAFGITSALITFVVQKTREIGILKALGASSLQIMGIFLGQSCIVGVLGVAAGLGLGILAVQYRNSFLVLMRRVTDFELFPAQIYGFAELPAMIIPADIAAICGGSLVICILAGWFPAWNAGRLKPVEALRHE